MANIAEILSNYPLGTQLYSPVFGRVRLKKIRPHLAVIVTDAQGEDWELLYDGRFSLDGECILFPSKAERDWNLFGKQVFRTMTKQEFTELFEVLQQYHEQSRELGEMLHKTLLNGHSVVCFGSKLQEAYIKLLYDVSGVPTEHIEQLLYEGSFSMWIGFEGEQKEYRFCLPIGIVLTRIKMDLLQKMYTIG